MPNLHPFAPRLAVEMTLAAALRDIQSPRDRIRHLALRNLGPALLQAIGSPGPQFEAFLEHPEGQSVRQYLQQSAQDDSQASQKQRPHDRGLALLGLARIGDLKVLDYCEQALAAEHLDTGAMAVFWRECAVIALGEMGMILPSTQNKALGRIAQTLESLVDDPRPEVRYQVPLSWAQAELPRWAQRLAGRLELEEQPEVVRSILEVLSKTEEKLAASQLEMLEDQFLSAELRAAQARVSAPSPQAESALWAALVLARHHRPAAEAPLYVALQSPGLRDLALLGLSDLAIREAPIPHDDPFRSPAQPQLAAGPVASLLLRWAKPRLWPKLSQVHAATALLRYDPAAAQVALKALSQSFRPGIREAAREALRDLPG